MKIVEGMMKLNQPTGFNIYDQYGTLLLSKGIVPYSQEKIDRILEMGCYTTPYGEQHGEFYDGYTTESVEELMIRLEVAYTNFVTDGYNLIADVAIIADEMIEGLRQSPDMFIGMVHLRSDLNHAIFRMFQNTVLAILTARALKWSEVRIQSLACAGLTQNIAMYLLQQDLERHQGELMAHHQRQIQEHPKQGGKMLRAMGVLDVSWVQAVISHHEQLDGQGYPFGSFGKDIPMEARLLAVVDRYASFISPRDYREASNALTIMRQFLTNNRGRYDQQMAKALIAAIGVYPPGVIVKLESGELALVTQRAQQRTMPVVQAIWKLNGEPYARPVERDSSEAGYKIVTVMGHEDAKRLNADLFWGAGDDDQLIFREKIVEMASGEDGHRNEIGLYAEQPE